MSVDGTVTIGMRRLVHHNPKIVAAFGTGSGYIPGHGGGHISQGAPASQLAV
jgi:hypothetical protein